MSYQPQVAQGFVSDFGPKSQAGLLLGIGVAKMISIGVRGLHGTSYSAKVVQQRFTRPPVQPFGVTFTFHRQRPCRTVHRDVCYQLELGSMHSTVVQLE